MSIAAGEGVEDTLAPVALGDPGVYCLSPEREGTARLRAVRRAPAIVRHGGHARVTGHGIEDVESRRVEAAQEMVPVDSGSRGHAAHPDVVVPGRNHACYVRAMVVEGVVDIIFAGVVVIELAVDVVLQVLMGVVHPVVHDGNVDPLSLDSLFPDRLDVDVLPLGAAQVPLARI